MIRSMLSRCFGAPLGTAWARRAAGALLVLATASCQSSDGDPPIGGETHFLKCIADSDCTSLSEDHICVDRFCELPATTSEDAGPVEIAVPDAAIACGGIALDASKMVILGDSFFATTHEITAQLEALARDAGVHSSDDAYRDYSRLVGNALAVMGNGIDGQYTEAMVEGPVSVVIMNGGGADALLGTCETVDAACPVIGEAVDAARDLLAKMAADGVTEVIYVFYPDAQNAAATREKVDALRPLIQTVCGEAATRCHWLDLRPTFEGNYAEYVSEDGLNPTEAGSEAVAREIWAIMQSNCIAQ
jgi:hypothetical protein